MPHAWRVAAAKQRHCPPLQQPPLQRPSGRHTAMGRPPRCGSATRLKDPYVVAGPLGMELACPLFVRPKRVRSGGPRPPDLLRDQSYQMRRDLCQPTRPPTHTHTQSTIIPGSLAHAAEILHVTKLARCVVSRPEQREAMKAPLSTHTHLCKTMRPQETDTAINAITR